MGQWEFWIVTTAILTLISVVAYYNRRIAAKRDATEKQLIDTLDALKGAISRLDISLKALSTGCYEKHKGIDRELKNMHDDINILKEKE